MEEPKSEEPKSLGKLFNKKIFRIPDYQRGYAWQESQLKYFWEDLINLSDNRSHYTGVLTLQGIASDEIGNSDNEHWLIKNHSYKLYHIVDGQQRLTSFVIFLQAFIETVREFGDNKGNEDKNIYITDSLNLKEVISKYIFKVKPTDVQFRTYKFGYER